MFKKILVPLDGSQIAESALNVALKIAENTGADLLLLQAVQQEMLISPPVIGYATVRPVRPLEAVTEDAVNYLGHIKDNYALRNVSIDTNVVYQDPAMAILDTVVRDEIDLIVMSTHGRSGLDRWVYGSVTERVMRHADCPVLAVRSADIPKQFLIPLDGSDLSENAIEPALALAEAFGARVILAHIQDTRTPNPYGNIKEIAAVDDGFAELVMLDFYRRGEHYLEKLAARYKAYNVEIDVSYGSGNPAKHIVDLAATDHCDLIAMNTHGRTGAKRFRYGSVTEKVLRNSDQAMLIVRKTGE